MLAEKVLKAKPKCYVCMFVFLLAVNSAVMVIWEANRAFKFRGDLPQPIVHVECKNTHTHTHTPTHTHTHTHPHTHPHTPTHTHTLSLSLLHIPDTAHQYTYTQLHIPITTHTYIFKTHSHSISCIHTHRHTNT